MTLKNLIKSPHIQIALTTGICIIVLAYFSKRILPEPIGYLPLAIPPFIASIYEAVAAKHKNKKNCENIVLGNSIIYYDYINNFYLFYLG